MATLTESVKAAAGQAKYTPTQQSNPAYPSTPPASQTQPGSGGQYGVHIPNAGVAPAARGSITFGPPLPASGGGTGGGGSQNSTPMVTGSTQTQQMMPIGPAPEFPALPQYTAPQEWSASKKAGEVQKEAGLGLREERRSLREATAGLGTDPASAFALREALAQHGINVERTLLGAREAVTAKENADLARRTREAEIQYQAKINQNAQKFQAEYNKWLTTAKTTSTASSTYDTQGNLLSKLGQSLRIPGPGGSYFTQTARAGYNY